MSDDLANDIRARVEVRQQILSCTRCGLRTICTRPVPWSGDNPSPLAIVGEAPGKEEDARGKPFVGPSGALLRKVLRDTLHATDEELDRVAFLNVVSCFPNRTPHALEVAECRDNLDAQLRILRPRYALMLGGVAISAFWPRLRIGEMRGLWWQIDIEGAAYKTWVLATWHPSAVLRAGGINSKIGREFRDDVERWVASAESHRRPGVNGQCVKCGKGAEVWRRNMGACREHQASIGVSASASTAGRKRSTSARSAGGTAKASNTTSARSQQKRGPSATRMQLFDE